MKESVYITAARIVLRDSKAPLHPKDIIDKAIEQHLIPDSLAGQTPHQTLKAKLSVKIRREKGACEFARAAPGKFVLRERLGPADLYEPDRPQNTYPDEKVIVFPAKLLDLFGRKQGIQLDWQSQVELLLSPVNTRTLERRVAEATEEYKQVICYVLVRRNEKLLAFTRGKYRRIEQMLRGQVCIGFGGHVADSDKTLFTKTGEDVVLECARRELSEELQLPGREAQRLRTPGVLKVIATLNDDSSSVGRKHWAVVLEYNVKGSRQWQLLKKRERSISELRWLDARSISNIRDFEYWSQLCLLQFFAATPDERCSMRIVRRIRSRPEKHLLAVVGPIGSGKSETTSTLCRDFGYHEVNSGRVLADMLGIPAVTSRSRPEFQARANDFIQAPDGPSRLAAKIAEYVRASPSQRIVIDGIRQPETLAELKNLLSDCQVGTIFVHTPPHIALQFYRNREGNASALEFFRLREADVEKAVHSMIRSADAVLYNWEGRREYKQVIGTLLSQFFEK